MAICGDVASKIGVLQGPKQLPISWFHIPCIVIVNGTSHGPQFGNYLAPAVPKCHGFGSQILSWLHVVLGKYSQITRFMPSEIGDALNPKPRHCFWVHHTRFVGHLDS